MTARTRFYSAGLLATLAALPLCLMSGCGGPSQADVTRNSDAGADADLDASSTRDRVTVGTPQRKTLTHTTTQPGRIVALEETPLFPKVTGYVGTLAVDIGDRVTAGETLVKIHAPELQDELAAKQALVAQAQAEIVQAEANVAATQAALATAEARIQQAEAAVARAEADSRRWQSEYERIGRLAERGSVTEKLVDETRSQFRSAEAAQREAVAVVAAARAAQRQSQADVSQAEADVGAAQARLQVAQAEAAKAQTMRDYTEVPAPFDGVITRRNVDSGHFVQPAGGTAQPLLVVARTDRVRVCVDVPETEAGWVDGDERRQAGSEKPGDKPGETKSGETELGDDATVRVQALGGREFTDHVTRTSWSLDQTNRSLRAEIELPSDGSLRPGMFATVTIVLEKRQDTLTVPATAIVREGDKTFCCRVERGKVQRTPVELGLRVGPDVEVVSGLSVDDTIVLLRPESLQDGQAVEVLRPAK
jgi:RND family efflux transporter MFP subunit